MTGIFSGNMTILCNLRGSCRQLFAGGGNRGRLGRNLLRSGGRMLRIHIELVGSRSDLNRVLRHIGNNPLQLMNKGIKKGADKTQLILTRIDESCGEIPLSLDNILQHGQHLAQRRRDTA